MLRFSHVMALVCLCSLFLLVSNADATTYTFGVSGLESLTGSGAGKTWTSSDQFIIGGDVYIPDNDTLTIKSGVTVKFDGSLSVPTAIPLIEVKGTIICEGTPTSNVTFTNYSGTTRGLFKGLYLNGDSTGTSNDYEGTLLADYTVFEYGGYSSGLLKLGKKAHLDLNDGWIRFSDNYGIVSSADFDSLKLNSCYIDSNDTEGIYIQHESKVMDLSAITAFENGLVIRALAYMRQEIEDFYIEDAPGNGLVIEVEMPNDAQVDWIPLVYRVQVFSSGDDGIVIESAGDQIYGDVQNCASANNDGCGLYIVNYDPTAQAKQLRILNSVFWDNEASGVILRPTEEYLEDGEPIFLIQNCIMGLNGGWGFEIDDNLMEDDDFYIGDNINAYKDNVIDSYNDNVVPPDVIIEDIADDPDHFELASEAFNGAFTPPYDFHIKWDSPMANEETLINAGDDDEDCGLDVDGSQTDIGLFGGLMVDDFVRPDVFNLIRNLEFYVKVGDSGQPYSEWLPLSLPRNTYRNYASIWQTCTNVEDHFRMTSGTIIEFRAATQFRLGAGVEILGSVPNPIIMRGYNDSEWNGVLIDGDEFATRDMELTYVEIEDVLNSNWPGLYIVDVLEGEEEDPFQQVQLNYITVSNCNNGIRISDTPVMLLGCEATDNEGYGIRVSFGDDLVEIMGGVYSDNDGIGVDISGANCSPIIGFDENFLVTEGEYYTHIENNGSYGVSSSGGATPDIAGVFGAWKGLADITGNGGAQIYIGVHTSRPTLEDGANDIYFNEDEDPDGDPLAIEYENFLDFWEQEVPLDAGTTYWGRDDPDNHEEDLFDGPVNYDGWEEERNTIDDVNFFRLALNYYRNSDPDTVAMSIPLFKTVAEGGDYSPHSRFASLKHLRGASKRCDESISGLRRYFLAKVDNIQDRYLSRVAASEAIWCLSDLDCGQAAIAEAAEWRCDEGVNFMDSVLFAIDELCLRQIHDNHEIDGNSLMHFEEELDYLSSLIGTSGNKDNNAIPESFDIQLSSHPNPFNSTTNISFRLAVESSVQISIIDLNGRIIDVLTKREYSSGSHNLIWNANKVSSGTYYIKAQVGDHVTTKSISLMR